MHSSRNPTWLLVFVACWVTAFSTSSLRGPIFISEPPDRVDFSNSTGASVECSAHGLPNPALRWQHADGTPVVDMPGIRQVQPNGSLVFYPFRAESYRQDIHAGKYYCVASSPLGSIRSRPVYVRAVVQQFYEVQVYDEFVIQGNTAVLRCHIPPFVREQVHVTSWIRNHNIHIRSSVNAGTRFAMLKTGELYVYQVTIEDGMDSYRCQTANRLTREIKISAPGRIIVSDPKSSIPPRIIHSSTAIWVAKGERAELPCVAQGLPVPKHTWFRMVNSELKLIKKSENEQMIHGILLIEDTKISDSGIYVCKATNLLGEEKYEIILNVNENLSAYVEPQEIMADVGQRVQFTCVASGHPITSVEWLKDAQLMKSIPFTKSDNKYVLTIDRVDAAKRGMYQCLIGNEESTAQGTTELRLGAVTPEIAGVFPAAPVKPESIVVIQCVVTGSPIPIVSWYLDNEPLTIQSTMKKSEGSDENGNYVSSITFSSVKVQDGGYYKCLAKNDAGQVEHEQRLDVYGPVSIRRMTDVTAVEDREIKFHCPVTGYPISSISWIKNDKILPANHRQQVFTNGTLWIQKLSKSMDGGVYTCIARNEGGQSSQQSRTLKVMVPPVIDAISFPARHVVHLGSRVRLQCVVTEGDLPFSIRWLKDERPIAVDPSVNIRQDEEFASTLTIVNITSKHQGNYTCIVSNRASSVNASTEIVVKVPPSWISQPMDTSVLYLSDVLLECAADGSPIPTITWKKSSGRFSGDFVDLSTNSTRYHLLSNGSLHIRHVTENDEGQLLCEVHNGVGQGLSKLIELNIEVPAQVEVKYQNKTAKKGESVHLECRSRGDEPITFVWMKDGILVVGDDDRVIRNDFNLLAGKMSELVIYRTDRQDTGTYICMVSNSFGRDEGRIQLFLKEPPEPPENVRIVDHKSRQVHLSWTPPLATNSPITKCVIQFKLASEEWKDRLRNITVPASETSVIIDGLQPGTPYSFRIIAQNDVGFGSPSNGITISTVEEVPSGIPRNVHVESAGSQALLVSWMDPETVTINGELQGYYVGYKVHNIFGPYTYKTVTSHKENGEERVVISPLQKYTNYSVLVQAFNRAGAGPASDPVVGTTDEDVPSEPPENIMCKTINSQQLNLSWEPPPIHGHNGIIRGYKVMYSSDYEEQDFEEDAFETKTVHTTNIALHDLEKWNKYAIIVFAFTSVGDGTRSDVHYCQTAEDVPAAPADIKALIVSPTSVLLVWKPPHHPNGVITKYTVYMRAVEKVTQQTVKYSIPVPTEYQYQVTGLQDGRRYEFWITAATSVGEGESTKVVNQVPKFKVPARIATFPQLITGAVNSSVTLPCQVVGSPPMAAEWKYGDVVLKESKVLTTLSDSVLRLTDLKRNASGNYTCFVKNMLEVDLITHVVTVTAPPDSPTLRVASTTSSSIHLEWHINNAGGSHIRGCTLYYKREFDEWETLHLPRKRTNYTLIGLRCGTEYLLYLTCTNRIGASEPSSIITAHTNGTAPGMPTINSVLKRNSTSVELLVANWPDNGCPIRYFVIQYLDPDDQEWVLVSNSLQPQHELIVISDLKPGYFYKISVTAHNDAGTTVAHYEVRTLSYLGGVPETAITFQDKESYYLSLSFIIPVAISLLAVLVLLLTFAIIMKYQRFFYQRRRNRYCGSDNKDVKAENLFQFLQTQQRQSNETAMMASPHSANNFKPAESVYDDVCPYATSNIMESSLMDKQRALGPQNMALQIRDKVDVSTLYSKVKPKHQRDRKEGMILLQHKVPSVEDMYNVYQGSSEYQINSKHHQDKDHFSSDWNLKDKITGKELVCSYQERSQVPDLLYHGTDSSSPTPNDSSPDDQTGWSSQHRKHFTEWPNVPPCSYSSGNVTHYCTLGYPNCQCHLKELRPDETKFYPHIPNESTYKDDGSIHV